jgi:hypothetical protein
MTNYLVPDKDLGKYIEGVTLSTPSKIFEFLKERYGKRGTGKFLWIYPCGKGMVGVDTYQPSSTTYQKIEEGEVRSVLITELMEPKTPKVVIVHPSLCTLVAHVEEMLTK